MKKVIVFLLTAAIALGAIGFAHAAVTDSQDELLVYPTLEIGDASVLDGMTASMVFSCGNHLRWYTDYTFGGGTETEFSYSAKGFEEATVYNRNYLEVYLTSGTSTSISGGAFSLNNTSYGSMLKAVAAATTSGSSRTMHLKMADYVDYYLPEYELRYDSGDALCSHSVDLMGQINGEDWYHDPGNYDDLMDLFRFPVQENHVMEVTVEKDTGGNIVGLELYSENGPDLHFISAVNGSGIWFVPVFQDENGAPLPYESPAGHGVYYVPWTTEGTVPRSDERQYLLPDLDKIELLFPLEETLTIEHMEIDAEAGVMWMLTLENNTYVLTAYDLATAEATARIEALPHTEEDHYGRFVRDEGYLLVMAEDNIALVDESSQTLVLTAPDVAGHENSATVFTPADGDLHFDGEYLILLDHAFYREGTFWTAVFRQGELVYYGEYDCSLMRGNDNWYYSYIRVDECPIELK